MAIAFEPARFSPAERAAITGIKEAQERNLKRRGYFPEETPASNLLSIAAGLILQALDNLEVPPVTGSDVAKSGAVQVLLWAQEHPEAINDPKALAREKPIKFGPHGRKRYLAWGNNPVFIENLREATAPALIAIDLKSVAEAFVKRAPRPLWTVVEDG